MMPLIRAPSPPEQCPGEACLSLVTLGYHLPRGTAHPSPSDPNGSCCRGQVVLWVTPQLPPRSKPQHADH